MRAYKQLSHFSHTCRVPYAKGAGAAQGGHPAAPTRSRPRGCQNEGFVCVYVVCVCVCVCVVKKLMSPFSIIFSPTPPTHLLLSFLSALSKHTHIHTHTHTHTHTGTTDRTPSVATSVRGRDTTVAHPRYYCLPLRLSPEGIHYCLTPCLSP